MPQPELSTLPEIDFYGTWECPIAIIHVHPPGDAESVFRAYVDSDGNPACAPVPLCFVPWYQTDTTPISGRMADAFRSFVEHMAVGLQEAARQYAREQAAKAGNGVRRMLDVAPATLPRRR